MSVTTKAITTPNQITSRGGGSPTELRQALFHVLSGISSTWQLDQNSLAAIIHRSPSTISEWMNKESVSVSMSTPSPDDAQIYEFIEFYDSVSSLFVRVEDQTRWLKQAATEFGNKSPITILEEHPKNLYMLREWVDRAARP